MSVIRCRYKETGRTFNTIKFIGSNFNDVAEFLNAPEYEIKTDYFGIKVNYKSIQNPDSTLKMYYGIRKISELEVSFGDYVVSVAGCFIALNEKQFNKEFEIIPEPKLSKTGVLIARMQPLHNAHLHLVNTILKECEHCVIVLGSENKRDMLRNPFDIGLREEMLRECFDKEQNERITIFTLPDWSKEDAYEDAKIWGDYLYYNIVSRIQEKHLTYYYSDDPAIMNNWFGENIKKYINCRFLERESIFSGLSATKIRKAFEDDDFNYVKEYCPNSVLKRYTKLREIWGYVKENPKDDFSM